jgi:SAM-dependent methyltransferase
MAHPEQRHFLQKVKDRFPEFFHDVTVLEIGSLNINGTVRDFFHPTTYLGVDVGEGPGVDLVAEGQMLEYPDDSFDITISAECFEHNPHWGATFANMHRMAKTAVIFTCASDGRAEHGTTRSAPESSPLTIQWDYYANLNEEDFREHFDIDGMFSQYAFEYEPNSCDLYFWGIKQGASDTSAPDPS